MRNGRFWRKAKNSQVSESGRRITFSGGVGSGAQPARAPALAQAAAAAAAGGIAAGAARRRQAVA